jgi:hypothetical protein
MDFAETRRMSATVDVDGVRRDIESWNGILKHGRMGCQTVPSSLRNPVTALAAMNHSKIEGSMNERVAMSQVDIFPIREKMVTGSVGVGCVGWTDVMSMSRRRRAYNVIPMMILKPKPPVDGIVPGVRWVGNIKVNQVTPIHKTGRIKGHSCLESHTNQTPLSDFTGTNRVQDEEELIVTRNDLLR